MTPDDERLLIGRQNRRSLVSFGVVATARALGDRGSTLLQLRCECGAADCSAVVSVCRSDYERLMTSPAYLLVAPAHRSQPSTQPSRLVTRDGRFAIIDRG